MGRGFQVWKFHLKISPWEEKPCLPRAYSPWEASFSSRGLIFGGEEISIPETRPIRKSYNVEMKLKEVFVGFFMRHSSETSLYSCQAVVRQSSGNCQAVITVIAQHCRRKNISVLFFYGIGGKTKVVELLFCCSLNSLRYPIIGLEAQ